MLFSSSLFSQIFPKEIKGQVISDSLDVDAILVVNKNSNKSTITDKEGFFIIDARMNDTINFSAIQFKFKQQIITQDIYESGEFVIMLEEKVNELPDVVIRPYNLSGNLANDMKGINTDDVVNGATLGLPNATVRMPTQSERRLYTATSGGIFTLDPVINAITGRTKMLKNRVRLEKNDKELYATMNSFEKNFYLNHLKIPEENIIGFLFFCAADPKFDLLQGNSLLVLEFFELKSKEYLKNIASEK